MSKRCKTTLVSLLLAFVVSMPALPAYAQDSEHCEAQIEALETELDELNEDCLAVADAASAERDKAIRELAAESAVLAGLRVDFANLQRYARAQAERRARAEATLDLERSKPIKRPRRGLWALGGLAGGVVLTVAAILFF